MESHQIARDGLDEAARQLVGCLGDDPNREGLRDTPARLAASLRFLTGGYSESVEAICAGAVFAEASDATVSVRNLEFYSLCEHHMLPFFGHVDVSYVPSGKILGLSKISRIVDLFARRLQVQERLTGQIADAIESVLQPHGVAVVIEASHLCMMMRGVEKQDGTVVTSSLRGVLQANSSPALPD